MTVSPAASGWLGRPLRRADGRALTSGPVTAHPPGERPLAKRDNKSPNDIAFPPNLFAPLPYPDNLRASPAGDRP